MQHPSLPDLTEFLERAPGRTEQDQGIIRHLLADCSVCRARLQSVGRSDPLFEWEAFGLGSHQGAFTRPRYDYDLVFARTEEVLSSFLSGSRPHQQPPDALLAELAPLPRIDGGRSERPAIPFLVKWLIERSHGCRYNDHAEMLYWAHLGWIAADACSSRDARGERRLADLKAKAVGQFGNALRVSGRLADAEEAFALAERYREQGTGDLSLRAKLCEQRAALESFERRFEDASDSIDEAARLHRMLGDEQGLARTFVQHGIVSLYQGEPENGIRLFYRAIPLIDAQEDPDLLLATRHNLIRCLLDLDRASDAIVLHLRTQEAYAGHRGSLLLLRAIWQEGQLLRELGFLDFAEAAIRRARDGFVERGLAYEAAVVSLDLAAVYAKQGRPQETGQAFAETIPIFRALRIGRETLASLVQLQRAAPWH